jgi:hypothetical protein
MLFGFERNEGRAGTDLFLGLMGRLPGRNHRTGGPALLLRASSEQVTNHQFQTTPNILATAFCQVVSELKPTTKQNHDGYH